MDEEDIKTFIIAALLHKLGNCIYLSCEDMEKMNDTKVLRRYDTKGGVELMLEIDPDKI